MDKEALKKKTVAELRDLARELPDIKGVSTMKKDDLVELLAGGAGAKDEPAGASKAGVTQAKAVVGAPPLGKAEIKERIRALKAEKMEALAQEDRKKTRQCNRQIHRYKRQLRKMAKEAR